MNLWEIIRWPFGFLMRVFYDFTGGYIWALLLFAIVMKLVTLPFSIKQQKTQILNAKLRPKFAAIEKKYAGRTDQKTLQKKQQELQELQQKEGVSPLSGCLPMLVQLVIVIILYAVVQNPLTYICQFSKEIIETLRTAAGTVLESDLAKVTELELLSKVRELLGAGNSLPGVDASILTEIKSLNLDMLGLDLTVHPSFKSWLLIIPILVGVSSWGSMKLSRKFMGQPTPAAATPEARTSNMMMDVFMPIMSLALSFSLPAALGVYWVYQSILGVLQQFILAKIMPLPTFTEEELREIERAEKDRAAAGRAALRGEGPSTAQSLHFTDDDDEDVVIPVIRSKFDDEEYGPAEPKPAPKASGATRNNQRKKKR